LGTLKSIDAITEDGALSDAEKVASIRALLATRETSPTPAVDPNLTIESPSSFTIFTDLKQTVSTLTAESIDHFFAMQSEPHQSLKGIGQPHRLNMQAQMKNKHCPLRA
jgi:hypothetical protein